MFFEWVMVGYGRVADLTPLYCFSVAGLKRIIPYNKSRMRSFEIKYTNDRRLDWEICVCV